ncbi:MAG: c-type cytochrome, partial [bacterium]
MKRGLSYTLIFLPLLVGIVFLVLPLNRNRNAAISAQDSGATAPGVEPNKLIFTLQYISTDYGKAVQNRKVVNTSELQEMKDFSKAVLGWYQKLKPDFVHDDAYSKLRQLDDLINARAEGTQVSVLTGTLIQQLSKEFNVIPFPTEEPQLAQGKALFGSVCAVCHGISGDGLGPKAKELTPPPSAFQDPVQMNKVSPYQLFNAITYGVAGTAMPSHGQALTPIQRWDVAFYLLTLRKGFSPKSPAKKSKISIRDLAISSNEDLVHRLKTESESGLWADSGNAADAKWLAVVDYLRQNPPRVNPKEHLYYARQKINQSLHSYRQGHAEAAIELSLDAYLRGIEPLEPALRQKSSTLVNTVEQEFTAYRGALKSHQTLAEAEHRKQTLLTLFDDVKSTLQPSEAAWGIDFVQSLTIILREGVEAALLIAIMITYLVAAGYSHLKKFVTAGALTGIVVGGVTWLAAQIFLSITQLHQEALEGITSLLAATVLFSVSFWIIHNIDI